MIAAGEATRWNNYLGTPKHLIKIGGEPILHRTVRLFAGNDIYIVAKDESYAVEGAKVYIPKFNLDNYDVDKFLNSEELWSDTERTLVVYGDVYFTEKAVDKITKHTERDWRLFGRAFDSSVIEDDWGECFAQSFYPEHIPLHRNALDRVLKLYKEDVLDRCGGWEHYRAILGLPDSQMHRHLVGQECFTNIDDLTTDFDTPQNYDNFIKAYKGKEK